MSLKDMRCDKCGEQESVLYRAGPFGLPEVPWYCQDCMQETGQAPDEETERLIRIIKEHRDQQ